LAEAHTLTQHPDFRGIIADLGGPTADMYGFECAKKLDHGVCPAKRCLFPEPCPVLPISHRPQIDLLRAVRSLPGVRKVFVASGIRPDLIAADAAHGDAYLRELVTHHVSGQLKLAPEHSEAGVLQQMGKPSVRSTLQFKAKFDRLSRAAHKPQFLTYYLIAAHPGCTEADMHRLRTFAGNQLGVLPEQVQIFTPTPSTYASLMYYTELDPFTRQPLFVEKDARRKTRQKDILRPKESR
jgi:uncharacterized radical SAM protein YgiQ